MRFFAVLGIASAVACSQGEAPAVAVDPEAEYSAMRYSDSGLASLNDRCPVSGTPLSPDIEPLYVNGRPIGFC